MKKIAGLSLEDVLNKSVWVVKLDWGRKVGTYDEVEKWADSEEFRDIDVVCGEGQPEELRPFFKEFERLTGEHGWMTFPEIFDRFGEETGDMNKIDEDKKMYENIYNRFYKIGRNPGMGVVAIAGNGKCKVFGGKEYHIDDIAKAIEKDPKIREGVYYEAHNHFQIELTMSCSCDEAIMWMRGWMAEAIAAGNGKTDKNLRAMFLAAYDTFNSLKKGA